METANRDEALRCLEKAKTALREGRVEAARRLTSKSIKLCPTEQGEEFLNKVKSTEPSSSPRQAPRKEEEVKEEAKEATPVEKDYTPEQRIAVKRVLECCDYYEILSISRSASESDIKKQYKRLALQLHPDKNNTPKSDEAFKSVSKAYAVLSDKEKRNNYDRFGEDGLRATNSFAEPEVNPDEIFRMFFGDAFFGGGGFGSQRGNFYFQNSNGSVHRRNQHQQHRRGGPGAHPQQAPSTVAILCQLVPIIILVSVALFGNVLTGLLPTSQFSLHKSNLYPVQRIIRDYNIPYFVQVSFRSEYAHEKNLLASIERDVINEHMWELNNKCNNERYLNRRRGRGGTESDNCVKLKELSKKIQSSRQRI